MTALQDLRAVAWRREPAHRRWTKEDPHGRTLIVHADGMWIVRGPDVLPDTRQRIEHASGVEKTIAVSKARAERWAADNPPTKRQERNAP